jgi:hypothetical protein
MELRIGCCGFPVARRRYFEQFSMLEDAIRFEELVRSGC